MRKALLAAVLILCGCSFRTVHLEPALGPVRREVVVGADTISYEYTGDSAPASPVMVLVHGFGASLESWTDLQPIIAAHHPVLRLDLKGFGSSSKPRDDRYGPRPGRRRCWCAAEAGCQTTGARRTFIRRRRRLKRLLMTLK